MFSKVVALTIIIVTIATIVPYVVGVVKAFQSHIAIGITSIVVPPVGIIKAGAKYLDIQWQ